MGGGDGTVLEKPLPANHPYVQTDRTIRREFGGRRTSIVGIVPRDGGSVWRPEILEVVRDVTAAALRLPDVMAQNVVSLSAPSVRWVHESGDTIAVDYLMSDVPRTPAAIDELRRRVDDDPQLSGMLVTPDEKMAIVLVDFYEGATPHQLAERRRLRRLEARRGTRGPERRRVREGRLPRQHLEEHRPQREDVAALVLGRAGHLLRRHVGWRPPVLPPPPERVGEPEVQHLHLAVVAEEDVSGLQVPVDDAARVGVVEPLRHLEGDAHRLGQGKRTLLEPLAQRPAAEQLQHEVGPLLGPADVVERDEVGVLEAGRRLRLLLEASLTRRAPGAGAHRLEGDAPPQLAILRLPDHAEAAAAELPHQLVPPHGGAGPKGSLPSSAPRRLGRGGDLVQQGGQRPGPDGLRRTALVDASRHCDSPTVREEPSSSAEAMSPGAGITAEAAPAAAAPGSAPRR